MLQLQKLTHADADAYFRLTGDWRVMAFITGASLTRAESDAQVARLVNRFPAASLWGVWLAHYPALGFIGAGGLIADPERKEIDVGFRIVPDFWGQGWGTLLARQLLTLAQPYTPEWEIIASVDERNEASRKILQKLGMVETSREQVASGVIEIHLRWVGGSEQ